MSIVYSLAMCSFIPDFLQIKRYRRGAQARHVILDLRTPWFRSPGAPKVFNLCRGQKLSNMYRIVMYYFYQSFRPAKHYKRVVWNQTDRILIVGSLVSEPRATQIIIKAKLSAVNGLINVDSVFFCSKTMDFSETIVVYDIKVGRCSQLNESFMSTKGQGHWLTLVQIIQIQYF